MVLLSSAIRHQYGDRRARTTRVGADDELSVRRLLDEPAPGTEPMADAIASRFLALRDALAALFRQRASDGGPAAPMLADVGAEIARLQLPAGREPGGRLPGCRHCAAAMEEAAEGPLKAIAESFAALEPAMRWVQTEGYRAALGDDYMTNYAYTQVVGARGLVPHDRIAAGFFIIGPGRHYPEHHHEAEEVYLPFGGDTLWSQAGGPGLIRAAGEVIHNPPWQRHAMTTRRTPLFALYAWRGPVTDDARLVD
jgi:hypothetical protein